jgi:hypothetical protein
MGPGANVGVYGRFPTEVGADPFSVKDLDVYYRSALSRGCGLEDSTRTVPDDMGSNGVSGAAAAPTAPTAAQKGAGRRTRRYRSGHRGGSATDPSALEITATKLGDLFGSLSNRPYVSTIAPNHAQSLANSWSGNPVSVPTSSAPEVPAWSFKGTPMAAINPSRVITPMPSFGSYLSSGWNFDSATSATTGASATTGGSRRSRSRRNRKHKKTQRRR